MNRFSTAIVALAVLSSTAAQAIDLTPNQAEEVKLKSGKWMEQRKKVDELAKQSRYGDAENILKQIIADRQSLGLDLLSEYDALASLYMSSGRSEAALKVYEDMVAAREKLNGPDDPQVVYPLKQYANCLSKLGKKDQAKAVSARAASMQKNADTIPKFPPVTGAAGSPERIAEGTKMRAVGEKLMISEQQTKAKVYFDRAIQLNPNDAIAFCDRGDAEHFSEQFQKAASDLDKAIKMKPDLEKAYVNRAHVRENFKQYRLAITDLEKAIALDPKDTDAMGDRAKLLDNMGKHKEAIDGYTKVIAVNPALYWPYIQRSVAYAAIGQYKSAVDDLTKLVQRAPEDPDFHEYRAGMCVKAGELQKALEDYNKLIELSPKYSLGYHERAKIYEKLDGKRTARVLADYTMARKLGYTE